MFSTIRAIRFIELLGKDSQLANGARFARIGAIMVNSLNPNTTADPTYATLRPSSPLRFAPGMLRDPLRCEDLVRGAGEDAARSSPDTPPLSNCFAAAFSLAESYPAVAAGFGDRAVRLSTNLAPAPTADTVSLSAGPLPGLSLFAGHSASPGCAGAFLGFP